jgi:plasmid replication initiation protein
MEYEVVTDLNKSDVFQVAHKFTTLRGSEFNPLEIDFLFAFISQIDEKDEVLKEYRISNDVLTDKMERRMRKERVAQLFDSLIVKYIAVSTKDDEKRYSIFDTLSYNRREDVYTVKFSSEMKKFFLKLKPFTKGYLSDIFKLKSSYTKKIYLLCAQWKKAGSFKIKVDKLMRELGIKEGSSLEIYNRFKEKVLKVAEKNMIEKSSIYFEYEEIKVGKRVDELLFIIKDNPNVVRPKEIKEPKKTPKLINDDVSEEEQINVLIGRKIYVQDKLFFFTGLTEKDGKYQICVEDTNKQKALVPTINVSVDGALETVKKMMEEKETK